MCLGHLPSDTKSHWHHSCWNSTCVGVLIPRLSEELQPTFTKLDVETTAQTAAHSVLRNPAEYLVCLHEGIEEPSEERIEDENWNEHRASELGCTPIVSNPSHDIGVEVTPSVQSKLGIYCDRPHV